jgi:hypothetical protein
VGGAGAGGRGGGQRGQTLQTGGLHEVGVGGRTAALTRTVAA